MRLTPISAFESGLKNAALAAADRDRDCVLRSEWMPYLEHALLRQHAINFVPCRKLYAKCSPRNLSFDAPIRNEPDDGNGDITQIGNPWLHESKCNRRGNDQN